MDDSLEINSDKGIKFIFKESENLKTKPNLFIIKHGHSSKSIEAKDFFVWDSNEY